jgi:replicative DNA helicase
MANFNHVPPHADDLEEAVLGAMLSESDALQQALGLLGHREEVFYQPAHRVIFRAVLRLFNAGRAVDIVSMAAQLKADGTLNKAGGPTALVGLTMKVSGGAHMHTHCLQLLEFFSKRLIGEVGRLLVAKAYDEMQDSFALITEAQQLLNRGHETLQLKRPQAVGEIYDSVVDGIVQATLQPGGLTGVPAGLTLLDKLTGGWQPSDLIIIAARPGMGKTSLALANAVHASLAGYPGAFFSLEMSTRQLVRKMIGTEAGYTTAQLQKGKLGGGAEEAEYIRTKAARLKTIGLYIDDTPSLSIGEFRAKATRLKSEFGIRFIVVDYLQLMTGDAGNNGKPGGNREQEIASISRTLKKVAKELDIPVIALSQLSRSVETRGGDKRPMLSDLRESGAIEQDADIIIFPFRPEYYKVMEDEMGNPTADTTELIVAKNRNGGLATGNEALVVSSKMAFGRYSDFNDMPALPDEPAPSDEKARTDPHRFPASKFEDDDNDLPF